LLLEKLESAPPRADWESPEGEKKKKKKKSLIRKKGSATKGERYKGKKEGGKGPLSFPAEKKAFSIISNQK